MINVTALKKPNIRIAETDFENKKNIKKLVVQ